MNTYEDSWMLEHHKNPKLRGEKGRDRVEGAHPCHRIGFALELSSRLKTLA